ncbi:MAG: hypothetical protein COB76_01040 [Alphaproteobacteria bacterium]|nr:MAG: hypothetical protein COB76_01040 [Alphaproteobacteria bacterium]
MDRTMDRNRALDTDSYGELIATLASSNKSVWQAFNSFAEGRVNFTSLSRTDIDPEFMKKLGLYIDQGLDTEDVLRWAQSYRQAYEAGLERTSLKNVPKLVASN